MCTDEKADVQETERVDRLLPLTDLPVDDNIALLQCNTEVSKRPAPDPQGTKVSTPGIEDRADHPVGSERPSYIYVL